MNEILNNITTTIIQYGLTFGVIGSLIVFISAYGIRSIIETFINITR